MAYWKTRLAQRIINKLIRTFARFIDSYSLYFNLGPSKQRVKKLASFAKIGNSVKIARKIIASTPSYLELCDNVQIEELYVSPKKFVLIEKDVNAKAIQCKRHAIVTKNKIYEGDEIPENIVTISVDVEGGVALSHAAMEEWDYLKNFWNSKTSVENLAKLFIKYEIPVTWAICGHLFLIECNGQHGVIEKDWFGDWFKYDPATNHKNSPAWYMPDVIQNLAQEPLFEIAYHSFGHYRYQGCSQDTVVHDIVMAKKIREEWGLKLETFIFPYNQIGHLDLLVNEGRFQNFRGNIGLAYPAYGIFDFKTIRFFNTTQMFSPNLMALCFSQLGLLGQKTFNYYTHCYQWIEREAWTDLEKWLRHLARLRESKKIVIKRINEI